MDTNALSAAAEEDPDVLAILGRIRELALPVVVIGEYRFGIAHSRYATRYEQWLDGLIGEVKILDITEETTRHYSAIASELLRSGKPIPTNDMWIAALSRQHAFSILSADRHFDAISGIHRLSW